MKQAIKKVALAVACVGGMAATMQAEATNWLMLQGTEPTSTAGRAKVWGFLQPTYQKDRSDIPEGKFTGPEPTRIGPNLESQEQMQLYRARIGVRGTGMPIDPKVNYFIMIEGGSNGATDGGRFGHKTPVRLMDASITLNHIPGARIRTGLFKTPGPEEILQGIATLDYINLTWVSNQLMMERFPTGTLVDLNTLGFEAGPNVPGVGIDETSGWSSSFGAGRDIGLQVFDSFKNGDWDTSYAIMIGNGNGLETGGIAEGQDKYFYLSTEKSFPGGYGPKPNGMKFFVWSHSGVRKVNLRDTPDSTGLSDEEYDRTRQGIGMTYRRDAYRLNIEYMKGKGMIFQGPEKPNMGIGAIDNTNAFTTQDLEGEANGYYVDFGYRVPGTPWEVDLRYDVYNRSTDHEYITALFSTKTLGVQYHFNRKTRASINYEVRSAELKDDIVAAPAYLKTIQTNMSDGLDMIGNRLGLQLTHIF
jgi:hypothetical protein